ncbi:MAG: type VI secretion system accessory protein TagJ, partial [Methylococcales bacterium]
MTAEEHLKQGDLKGALLKLQDRVRANPANADYRVFLFQLLSVLGQWDRALTQLNVAGELDDATLAMVSMYRQVIACERFREEVFLGRQDPVLFGQPSEWVALLIQALKLTTEGRYAISRELRERAFDLAPAVSGTIDGAAFEWLADSDSRLGPVLEVIIEGRYFWVPLERIVKVTIEKPVDLRDVMWLPAHFTWTNGGEHYGVIPARYPASYQSDDPLFALSRKTAWQDCGEGLFPGLGQKILTTDKADYPLLDLRAIQFELPVESGT